MAIQGLILSSLLLWGQVSAGSAQTEPELTFDQNASFAYLTKQVAFGPRNPGSAGHLKCRDYLMEEMKKSCDNVRLQTFSHKWSSDQQTYKMWNIIGEQNWEKAKIRIALFAHWDTRPTADQESDPKRAKQPILGANDGASGVAVLMELMKRTKDCPRDLGIQYVLLDGEDFGPGLDEMFLGATAYAKAFPTPKPDYGILLDMIGDKDLRVPVEPNSQKYAPFLVDAIYAHARTVGLENTFPYKWGPTIEDDHIPLNEAGLRTVDLIDFDYAPWHTLGDTPDKCSAGSLGKVGKLLETWLKKTPVYKPRD